MYLERSGVRGKWVVWFGVSSKWVVWFGVVGLVF